MERDLKVNRALQEAGWIVLRFWDVEIERELGHCVEEVAKAVERRALSDD
jgi:very-short-patch-repair endonuclease